LRASILTNFSSRISPLSKACLAPMRPRRCTSAVARFPCNAEDINHRATRKSVHSRIHGSQVPVLNHNYQKSANNPAGAASSMKLVIFTCRGAMRKRCCRDERTASTRGGFVPSLSWIHTVVRSSEFKVTECLGGSHVQERATMYRRSVVGHMVN